MNITVFEWLWNNNKFLCRDKKVFDWAARNGHLNVVKYLIENRNEGCTTDAMDSAAGNGHLNVVKWLYENRNEGCY